MPLQFSRRMFLVGVGAAYAFGPFADSATLPAAATGTLSAQQLLDRRRVLLTGSVALTAMAAATPAPSYKSAIDARIVAQSSAAEAVRGSMATGSGSTLPWADLPVDSASTPDASKRSANLAGQFTRLREIAAAYATPGTAAFGSAAAAAQVVRGIDILVANHYSSSRSTYGNWWYWEIGIPRSVVDLLTMLGTSVPATTRDSALAAIRHYAPNPGRRGRSTTGLVETGANLADKSLITSVRGLLDADTTDIALGRDALSGGSTPANSLFTYVSSGDGFYTDGSYIQHSKIPYAGTYGVVALAGVTQMLALLAGSEWAVSDPNHTMIFDVVEASFAPYLINGRIMDTVRGRAVSRKSEQDHVSGFGAMSQILTLSSFAPADVGLRYREMIRGWTERYSGPSWAADAQFGTPEAIALLAESQASGITAAAPVSRTFFHAANERLVHRRATWSFTVNTSSSRIGRFEWGNKENGRGWYQGDGASFLYVEGDDGQFGDAYWPTVDSLALPGITANSVSQTSGVATGSGIPATTATYNGGVAFADRGGSVGAQVIGYVSSGSPTLTANKSWHVFDDGVVCVGSDITDTAGSSVVTIMENRGFAPGGIPTVTANGSAVTATPGAGAIPFQSWAHLDGVGGYVMLAPAGQSAAGGRLIASRLSGTWAEINPAINSGADSTESISRDYLRMDVAHGANPSAARYAYLMLPTADGATTQTRAANPGIRVAIVDGIGHAVHHVASATAYVQVFAAGTVDGITASARCAIGVAQRATSIEFAVADPTRATSTARIAFPFAVSAVQPATGVSVVTLDPLTVDVSLSGKKGSAVVFTATPGARMLTPDEALEVRAVVGKLALDSGGRSAGSAVTLYRLVNHANVRWTAVSDGGGHYRLVNKGNGLVLSSGGATASGSPVTQEVWTGNATQLWSAVPTGSALRYRLVNRASGLALDSGGSSTSGSTVKMWSSINHPNLEWEFRR